MRLIFKHLYNCLCRLWLGLVLIVGCSALLLFLNKTDQSTSKTPEIAILTISSRLVMENFLDGCNELFTERGYENGKNIKIRFYNPEGDLPTANMMADDIIQRQPALVMTASTPMLQVMANRNHRGTVRHVFGLVTDPFSALEGLDRKHPRKHPDWLGGYGSFQPVERLFDLMLKLRPKLKKVGTIRNAGEACSEATFNKAKAYCQAKGIELVDITVDSPAAVQEAVKAVLEDDIEAIWIGGDNTVEAAIELVTNEASKTNIPVFTHSPSHLKFGTAISLGANYTKVGKVVADLAIDVLEGKKTLKNMEIINLVPELMALNKAKLERYATDFAELDKLEKHANITVDAKGNLVNHMEKKKTK